MRYSSAGGVIRKLKVSNSNGFLKEIRRLNKSANICL